MTQETNSATAEACANIALIKYWGKRDIELNLPAVGSISLTLEALKTRTRVTFNQDLENDQLEINQTPASESQRYRVENFIDLVRKKSGKNQYAEIISENNFPTGAGLASSASAFAALSLAATHALGINLSKKELSELSRRGSGSASRSIFGGIVEMQKGTDPKGTEDFAIQLKSSDYWDLRLMILVTSEEEKKIGSTEAMKMTALTSPYYKNWIDTSNGDLNEMRDALEDKDIEKLGDLSEFSALKMHALTLSSRPAIIYWNNTTLKLIEEVKLVRERGIPCWFTIDAGPQVKVITLPDSVNTLREHFSSFQGVERIIESRLGPDVSLIGDSG